MGARHRPSSTETLRATTKRRIMSTMTLPAETNMHDQQESDGSWYGFDLELRTPPPMSSSGGSGSNGHNMMNGNGDVNGQNSRKRTYDEAATPVQETLDGAWEDSLDLLEDIGMNVTPQMGFITPEFSQNEDGSVTFRSSSDSIEGGPRTKMQTGCIPCLYVCVLERCKLF